MNKTPMTPERERETIELRDEADAAAGLAGKANNLACKAADSDKWLMWEIAYQLSNYAYEKEMLFKEAQAQNCGRESNEEIAVWIGEMRVNQKAAHEKNMHRQHLRKMGLPLE